MKAKELIEAAQETLNTKSTGSDIELACSLLNQALTALATEQEEKQKEIMSLQAALVWSKKFDNINCKDMREFLQALTGKGKQG